MDGKKVQQATRLVKIPC